MTKTQLKNKIEKYLKEQETDIDKVLSNTELFNEIDYRLASAVSEIGLDILDIKNDADAYTTIQFYSKSLGYSIVLNEDFWIGDHSASSFYDQIKRELDKVEYLETKLKGLN